MGVDCWSYCQCHEHKMQYIFMFSVNRQQWVAVTVQLWWSATPYKRASGTGMAQLSRPQLRSHIYTVVEALDGLALSACIYQL